MSEEEMKKEATPATEATASEVESVPTAPEAAQAQPEAVKAEAVEPPAPASKSGLPPGLEEVVPAAPKRKMKGSKNVTHGVVHIKATFNNTQVSISDNSGAVISWSSAGRCGFKGSRKSTAYAGTVVAQEAARTAQQHGLQEVEIRVQGPGAGRESAIRAIQSVGISISAIKDVTPVPHNGCRPRKRRRV